VGPSRSAHEKLYSQTNWKFIKQHDLDHAHTTHDFLQIKHPGLFSAFRALHDKIESLTVSADQDYLHMGLFLLGHKFVDYLKTYSSDTLQPNLVDTVRYGLLEIVGRIKSGFYLETDHNYVVLYKDALVGMAQVMEKNASDQMKKIYYKGIQNNFSKEKRKEASENLIPRFLGDFIRKFEQAVEPLIIEIDRKRAEEKDVVGERNS
jgi:hypothetical protein